MKRRGRLFWMLLAAYAALSVWWALHVPRDLARLPRAIPAGATFVSVHDGLAARWDDVAANPLTRTLLASLGLGQEEVDRLLSDPATRRWVRRLAHDRTIVAYVPRHGGAGDHGWAIASWIGGRSQRLRWILSLRRQPGIRRIVVDGVHPAWIRRLAPGSYLSFALADGMLLACVSADPSAVRHLLAAADGAPYEPSLASAGRAAEITAGGSGARDFGWLDAAAADGAKRVYRYELERLSAAGSAGTVRGPLHLAAAPALVPADYEAVARLLGALPEAFCALPGAWVADAMSATGMPAWARSAAQLARPSDGRPSAPAFAALLGGEYSARIRGMFGGDTNGPVKGLKLPALLVGVRAGRSAAESSAAVESTLDAINAACRWGLIPHRIEAAGRTVTVLEETRDNLYGRLALGERAAWIQWEDWLVFASSAEVLIRVLEAGGQDAPAAPPWRAGIAEPPGAAFAWADLDAGGRTIRDGLAAWSLALMGQDAPGRLGLRQRLSAAGAWTEAFQPMRLGTAWIQPGQAEITLRLVLGVPQAESR